MPYPLSDEESSDSDSGVRFKTTNTRDKFKTSSSNSYKTKSSNEYKHNSHVSSSQSRYDLDRIYHKESKSKGSSSSKYHNERSRSARRDDKYSRSKYRSRTPEKYSLNDHKKSKRYSTDDFNYKHRRDDNDIKEKNKDYSKKNDSVSSKFSKEKHTTKINVKSQLNDLDIVDQSISEKRTVRKLEITEISDISSKESSSKSDNMETDICDNYFGPSLPPKTALTIKYVDQELPHTSTESQILKSCKTAKYSDVQQNKNEPDCFGPSLPPKLNIVEKNTIINKNIDQQLLCISKENQIPKESTSESVSDVQSKNEADCFSPSMPSKLNTVEEINTSNDSNEYGPIFLAHLKNKTEEFEKEKNDNLIIGPALLPTKNTENKISEEISKSVCKIMGPVIPDHFRANIIKKLENNGNTANEITNQEFDLEDDIIGPLPPNSSINSELEERALQIKLDLLNETGKESTSREEWMLELPEVRSIAQALGPRKFRAKEMPDMSDRSSWTDIGKDKANKKSTKVDIKLEAKLKNIKEKDLLQDKIVEKHKKSKRCKSLIDIHKEDLEKKKIKDQSETNERRPFSRDIDLKTNRFDDAQTKAIIKKARLLDNRFSSGQSKFL